MSSASAISRTAAIGSAARSMRPSSVSHLASRSACTAPWRASSARRASARPWSRCAGTGSCPPARRRCAAGSRCHPSDRGGANPGAPSSRSPGAARTSRGRSARRPGPWRRACSDAGRATRPRPRSASPPRGTRTGVDLVHHLLVAALVVHVERDHERLSLRLGVREPRLDRRGPTPAARRPAAPPRDRRPKAAAARDSRVRSRRTRSPRFGTTESSGAAAGTRGSRFARTRGRRRLERASPPRVGGPRARHRRQVVTRPNVTFGVLARLECVALRSAAPLLRGGRR